MLVISDLHIPFHREELILDIIKKHKDEIDTIIFGGDLIDCYYISSFSKQPSKPLIEELATAYNFLMKIDRIVPEAKKIMIKGNHEERFVRYLENNPNELSSFYSNNILDILMNGFTKYDRITGRKKIYPHLPSTFQSIDNWFVQYKDIIVAHPSSFSKVNLKTATSAVHYFLNNGFNFNVMLVAHTHKFGTTIEFNKFTSEIGCLCHNMSYSRNGKLSYTPQNYGYALMTIKDGVTDINDSRIYSLNIVDEVGDEIWQEEELDLKT